MLKQAKNKDRYTQNSNKHHLELNEDEMRLAGYKVIDTIIDHQLSLSEKFPVAIASRNEMDNLLEEPMPEDGSNIEEVLGFVERDILANCDFLAHPKSFSFVPGPGNYVSVLADTLAKGFNIFSGGWATSPAAAEIEIITLNWLLKLFKFPSKKGGGLFTSGGSMANLTAIATARRLHCGDDFSKAVIYMSDQAHSSNIKAIRVLGFQKDQVRIIPTDLEFKMAINKLKNAIARDKLEGHVPFCIIASAGTTNTGAIDPLNEIAAICKTEKLWFHIDGAYGAAAILAKKGVQKLKGIEKADSLTIDPHKWLYQPYEIGCLLVRDHRWLSKTFMAKAEYLRDIEGNKSEINFYDHGIQLTRCFRALKLYMSIKTFGLNSFREAISYGIDLAEKLEEYLRRSPNWEVISPASLAVINFRYNPIKHNYSEKQLDEMNQKISNGMIESRKALLVTTILHEKIVLRMCLINPRTTFDDILETITECEAIVGVNKAIQPV